MSRHPNEKSARGSSHDDASFHHDLAAYHHGEAATHRDRGNHDYADRHGVMASHHAASADWHVRVLDPRGASWTPGNEHGSYGREGSPRRGRSGHGSKGRDDSHRPGMFREDTFGRNMFGSGMSQRPSFERRDASRQGLLSEERSFQDSSERGGRRSRGGSVGPRDDAEKARPAWSDGSRHLSTNGWARS